MSMPPQPPPYRNQPPTGAWPPPNGGPPYPPPPDYPLPRRRWTPLRIALVAVVAVVVLCGVAGLAAAIRSGVDSAATPPSSTSPATDGRAGVFDAEPGTALSIPTGDGGVQEVTVLGFQIRASCGNLQPKHGSYLVVDVLVVQRDGVGSVNPMDFTFTGSDGTTANSGSGMFSGCEDNHLGSTNSLRAGQKRAGQIVFDVTNADGVVELAPGLAGDTAGSWKIG